jgi:hypothetical protein
MSARHGCMAAIVSAVITIGCMYLLWEFIT